jgi:hypothetical protein
MTEEFDEARSRLLAARIDELHALAQPAEITAAAFVRDEAIAEAIRHLRQQEQFTRAHWEMGALGGCQRE